MEERNQNKSSLTPLIMNMYRKREQGPFLKSITDRLRPVTDGLKSIADGSSAIYNIIPSKIRTAALLFAFFSIASTIVYIGYRTLTTPLPLLENREAHHFLDKAVQTNLTYNTDQMRTNLVYTPDYRTNSR